MALEYTIGSVTDSADQPPRKTKRAKRAQPDFVLDKAHKANTTIELQTADLLQLGQSGIVEAIQRNNTRELSPSDLEDVGGGVVDPKVIVDLGPDPDTEPPPQPLNVDGDSGPGTAAAAPPQAFAKPRLEAPARLAPSPRSPSPGSVQRATAMVPRVIAQRASSQMPARHRAGLGLVVVVYILSAAALAIASYVRFLA